MLWHPAKWAVDRSSRPYPRQICLDVPDFCTCTGLDCRYNFHT